MRFWPLFYYIYIFPLLVLSVSRSSCPVPVPLFSSHPFGFFLSSSPVIKQSPAPVTLFPTSSVVGDTKLPPEVAKPRVCRTPRFALQPTFTSPVRATELVSDRRRVGFLIFVLQSRLAFHLRSLLFCLVFHPFRLYILTLIWTSLFCLVSFAEREGRKDIAQITEHLSKRMSPLLPFYCLFALFFSLCCHQQSRINLILSKSM